MADAGRPIAGAPATQFVLHQNAVEKVTGEAAKVMEKSWTNSGLHKVIATGTKVKRKFSRSKDAGAREQDKEPDVQTEGEEDPAKVPEHKRKEQEHTHAVEQGHLDTKHAGGKDGMARLGELMGLSKSAKRTEKRRKQEQKEKKALKKTAGERREKEHGDKHPKHPHGHDHGHGHHEKPKHGHGGHEHGHDHGHHKNTKKSVHKHDHGHGGHGGRGHHGGHGHLLLYPPTSLKW